MLSPVQKIQNLFFALENQKQSRETISNSDNNKESYISWFIFINKIIPICNLVPFPNNIFPHVATAQ